MYVSVCSRRLKKKGREQGGRAGYLLQAKTVQSHVWVPVLKNVQYS
jgi:hypothetical protein